MCGRFSLSASADDLAEFFGLDDFPPLEPRFNIAPSTPVAVIRANKNQANRDALFLRWGLIPSWAKDPEMGNHMINARSETVSEKPSFRTAFKRRRCLIPANGFYEWKQKADAKQPYFIRLRNEQPLVMAGLWEHWSSPDGNGSEIETCTILTTSANALMEPIHQRMPVILSPNDFNSWLDPENEKPEGLKSLLKPCDEKLLIAQPISSYVNNPRNEGPQCVEPAAEIEKQAPKPAAKKKKKKDPEGPSLFD